MLIGPLAGIGSRANQQSEMQWVIYSTLDHVQLPPDLEVVEDYGSFVLGRMPANAITAGEDELEVLRDRTQVTINNTSFDSQLGEPEVPAGLRSAAEDPYFLVQFIGPIKPEWLEELQTLGVTILGYHPSYTYIVRMDPALSEAVQRLRAVQWVGHYHPAYRLVSEEELKLALTYEGRLALDISFFEGEALSALQEHLAGLNVQVEWFSEDAPYQARVWAYPEQLSALAAVPGVYRVEAYNPPTFENEKADQVMHTWDIWRAGRNRLGVDLMGAGQIAGMVDSGLDDNDTSPLHLDFYDYTSGVSTTRIQAAVAGNGCSGTCTCYPEDHLNSSGHGTHVAGSIVGNGYLSLMQQGLQAQARSADPSFDYAFGVGQAPEAKIAFAYVAGSQLGTEGTLCGIGTARTTWTSLYTQGARNVNNSWGSTTTSYGGNATNADREMWTYQDYLIITSAGNAGPGWSTVGQPGTAKNIITVGAAGNHRSVWDFTSSTASLLTDFSSRGPITAVGSDGRAKPDIVAPGADILSVRSTFIANSNVPLWGNEPGDGDANGVQDYTWSGGTSMSSPQITGAATVVRDYLQDIQNLGDTTPPSAALVKGFLLNGAVDMGYGYEATISSPYGGRNLQGWGMANIEQSIAPRAPRSFFYDDFTSITNAVHQSTRGMNSSGDYVQYTVNVVNASEPLKITLNWTDPQSGAQSAFVNNLDLLVTAPGGATYRGNVFIGSWSATGGSADTKNNTEAVYIQNPALGSWTIRVTATAWASGTQPFALVASGGFGVTPVTTRACSGTTDCLGRMGNSARSYYPTLVQLSGTQEHTAPGSAFTTNIRLTNFGTSSDTYTLSTATTDKTGAAVSGLSISYTPAGPYALASGASQDIQATIIVATNTAQGAYDVAVTATSGGNSAIKDAQVIGLNVIPSTSLYNEKRVVADSAAQYSPDFWAGGQNLWTAYLSA
ncbi:MAG TPA: S8 family serine peptidase, partial [Anaerolineaceae bacterium]|nr:S8 family serine peptidase [Anaerolineaceae bacterium]